MKLHVKAARAREANRYGFQCGTGLLRASLKPRGRNAIAKYTVDGEPNEWCRRTWYIEGYKHREVRQMIYTANVSDISSPFNFQIGAKPVC